MAGEELSMKEFIDRIEELKTLENEYQRSGSSLVILYGRRRIGKTTLISEFIKNKNALFFLASEESEVQNRHVFQEKAADFIHNDLLRHASVDNWDILFQAIMNTAFEQKPVIVMDEFQYIGKSNSAFPSIFQRIWEEYLKDKDVMVILCGSLISMMVSQTLAYDSPLYGRRTAQIRLKQIPFTYYAKFFPGKSYRELVESYSVTGGVPKYIELFSESDDVVTSISNTMLNTSGYLYNEPYFLLQQEVSETGRYFSIIRTIASGNRKISTIASSLETKATSLSQYLNTLIDLDILEREVPVTEDNPSKSKKGQYKIKDYYIQFWFSFIYRNQSYIESGNISYVFNTIRQNLISSHTAFVYEDVCREAMWKLSAEGKWSFHFSRIGRWWDAHHEIDIAAIDPEGKNIILGECKFWNAPVGMNILQELELKSEYVTWNKESRKTWYILFSISGFTEELRQLSANRNDILLVDDSRRII